MGQKVVQLRPSGIRLALAEKASRDVLHDFLADIRGEALHAFEQRRGLPVKSNDLHLAIDAFGNRQDGFIDRAAGDG